MTGSESHGVVSADVLGSYAADAAAGTTGVRGLVESALHRYKGVRIADEGDGITVDLHVAVEWGASIPDVGRAVQRRVGEYLERMANVRPTAVNVVVDEVV